MRIGGTSFKQAAAVGAQPADVGHVRGLAALSIAIGLLAVYLTIFPEVETVPVPRNIFSIVVLIGFGLALWLMARQFRIWMLHAALLAAIAVVLIRLADVETIVGSAITLSIMTWFSVLVGLVCAPFSARLYLLLILGGTGMTVAINPSPTPLGAWLAFAIGYVIVTGILSGMSTRLRSDAVTDSLTGLRNRKGLLEAGAIAASFASRSDLPLTAVQIDLEGFKAVNDSEGHEVGDRVLTACATAWSGQIRGGDVLARAGGDEFTLLLTGTDASAAAATLERMRAVSPIAWTAGLAELRRNEAIRDCIRRADEDLTARKAARPDPAPRGRVSPQASDAEA